MILITFAVPQESRGVFARLRDGKLGGQPVTVVHTGMGRAAAAKALKQAIDHFRPDWVLCSGFAGGLDPEIRTGTLIAASNFSSPHLLDDLPPEIASTTFCSHSHALDTPAAKRAHREQTGAAVVDMESSVLSAECLDAATPVLTLRIVSDSADEALPLPSGVAYDFTRQRIRHAAIAWYLATHPWQIPALVRFVRQLPTLQERLAAALEAVVQKAPQP